MFRPNRIGTPVIHTQDTTVSTLDFTLSGGAGFTGFFGNAINSTPPLDFGRDAIRWTGIEAVTAGWQIAFLQQITITTPLAGDVAGLEVNGAIKCAIPMSAVITPVFVRCIGVAGLLGAMTFTGEPTYFSPETSDQYSPDDTLQYRSAAYQKSIIVKDSSIGDTYAHGFAITDNSAAGWNFTSLIMQASIRQLNDQQDIGYRDTLR